MFDDADADRAQHGEEALRIADRRYRVRRLAGKLAQRFGCAVLHRNCAGRQQSHAHGPVVLGISAIDHDGVRTLEARRALAQRAGRQQAPIAEASIAVDDDDFAIALQSIVLQPIVADDDVAAGIDQELCRRGAIAPGGDRNTAAACQQDGLIADFVGIIGGLHQPRGPRRATVSA